MGKHAYEDGFAAGLCAAADETHREARWHSERALCEEGSIDLAHRLLTGAHPAAPGRRRAHGGTRQQRMARRFDVHSMRAGFC